MFVQYDQFWSYRTNICHHLYSVNKTCSILFASYHASCKLYQGAAPCLNSIEYLQYVTSDMDHPLVVRYICERTASDDVQTWACGNSMEFICKNNQYSISIQIVVGWIWKVYCYFRVSVTYSVNIQSNINIKLNLCSSQQAISLAKKKGKQHNQPACFTIPLKLNHYYVISCLYIKLLLYWPCPVMLERKWTSIFSKMLYDKSRCFWLNFTKSTLETWLTLHQCFNSPVCVT